MDRVVVHRITDHRYLDQWLMQVLDEHDEDYRGY